MADIGRCLLLRDGLVEVPLYINNLNSSPSVMGNGCNDRTKQPFLENKQRGSTTEVLSLTSRKQAYIILTP